MDIGQDTEIRLSEAVRAAMEVRGISEAAVRSALEHPSGTESISGVDRVCEGVPEPGRVLLVHYRELSDNMIAVLFVYEK